MQLQEKYVKVGAVLLSGIIIIATLLALNIAISAKANPNSTDTTSSPSGTITHIYLVVTGTQQGKIQGSANTAGHNGDIVVISYTHEVISPRDPATGLPTGKRIHKPLNIVKGLDKASIGLMTALINNENLQFTMRLLGPDPSGSGMEINFFTIQLTNANIASIRTMTQKDGSNAEVVSFVYQKITWTWEDGGITTTDDWDSGVV